VRLNRRKFRLLSRDIRETATFYRARNARDAARAQLVHCVTAEDFWSFTHRHFVRGAAQNRAEISSFTRYAASIEPRVVCEIGVQDGGTSFILSRALPTATTSIAIDLHVSLKAQLRFFQRPDVALHIIEGSSHAVRTRRKLTRVLQSRPIDVLFIDGDHSYEGVLRDLALYSPLVRRGGLIAFHDIVADSYSRYGILTDSYVGGVPTLWQRLRPLYSHREFIDEPSQDGRGIGVIAADTSIDVSSLAPRENVAP
jgi:predicted O-methyltransferase YrrM